MNTQLEQRGNGLAMVVLGGLALWAFSRRGELVEPRAPVGPVTLGGSVGLVRVGQAHMGIHRVEKKPFEDITVTVNWAGGTKDSKGSSMAWPYKLVVRLGHNTLLGWKDADQLGFPNTGVLTTYDSASGEKSSLYGFSAPDDKNQVWDIRAWLYAKKVDVTGSGPVLGNTESDYQEVAFGEHPAAVVTLGGNVALGGSVSSVEVAQQRGRLVGLARR